MWRNCNCLCNIRRLVLGYVTEALLGNHDGYQYIINVDDSSDDIAIVQGSEAKLNNGERVVIIFGKTIRVLPYSG